MENPNETTELPPLTVVQKILIAPALAISYLAKAYTRKIESYLEKRNAKNSR